MPIAKGRDAGFGERLRNGNRKRLQKTGGKPFELSVTIEVVEGRKPSRPEVKLLR
jgi:hypothetical protein